MSSLQLQSPIAFHQNHPPIDPQIWMHAQLLLLQLLQQMKEDSSNLTCGLLWDELQREKKSCRDKMQHRQFLNNTDDTAPVDVESQKTSSQIKLPLEQGTELEKKCEIIMNEKFIDLQVKLENREKELNALKIHLMKEEQKNLNLQEKMKVIEEEESCDLQVDKDCVFKEKIKKLQIQLDSVKESSRSLEEKLMRESDRADRAEQQMKTLREDKGSVSSDSHKELGETLSEQKSYVEEDLQNKAKQNVDIKEAELKDMKVGDGRFYSIVASLLHEENKVKYLEQKVKEVDRLCNERMQKEFEDVKFKEEKCSKSLVEIQKKYDDLEENLREKEGNCYNHTTILQKSLENVKINQSRYVDREKELEEKTDLLADMINHMEGKCDKKINSLQLLLDNERNKSEELADKLIRSEHTTSKLEDRIVNMKERFEEKYNILRLEIGIEKNISKELEEELDKAKHNIDILIKKKKDTGNDCQEKLQVLQVMLKLQRSNLNEVTAKLNKTESNTAALQEELKNIGKSYEDKILITKMKFENELQLSKRLIEVLIENKRLCTEENEKIKNGRTEICETEIHELQSQLDNEKNIAKQLSHSLVGEKAHVRFMQKEMNTLLIKYQDTVNYLKTLEKERIMIGLVEEYKKDISLIEERYQKENAQLQLELNYEKSRTLEIMTTVLEESVVGKRRCETRFYHLQNKLKKMYGLSTMLNNALIKETHCCQNKKLMCSLKKEEIILRE
ncbi:putative leucine-rich repeat-containing protein DDB_G0290503 isoform X3 [Periplaneta americana]|uniref:putative leucine-rich repeat-containing protein DDB_G0290503 isoform X3 n=1 Tax=Periplaneta americana TaxID=6978 RepID=UPI0037E96E25